MSPAALLDLEYLEIVESRGLVGWRAEKTRF